MKQLSILESHQISGGAMVTINGKVLDIDTSGMSFFYLFDL